MRLTLDPPTDVGCAIGATMGAAACALSVCMFTVVRDEFQELTILMLPICILTHAMIAAICGWLGARVGRGATSGALYGAMISFGANSIRRALIFVASEAWLPEITHLEVAVLIAGICSRAAGGVLGERSFRERRRS